MPAVAPAQCLGRRGGTWRPWKSVHVKQGGAWVQPSFVWAFLGGTWHLVWARTASPPVSGSVVATVTGAGEATITWDAPDPEAVDEYRVYRPGGSLAGTVPADGSPDYTFVDTAARPSNGDSYTIVPVLSGVAGTGEDSNAITIGYGALNPQSAFSQTMPNDVQVETTWTAVPGATEYRTYRNDGLGQGTATGLSRITTNPQPDPHARFRVVAYVNGYPAADEESTDDLVLAQQPGTPSGTLGGSNNNRTVALSWSLSGVGQHDAIQVLRDGSVLAQLAAGTTSYTDTNPAEGTQESYRIRARVGGGDGPQSGVRTVNITANVPTSVSCEATSTLGQLRLTWGNPAGSRTGYQVQANDGGWVDAGTDTVSPDYYTWAIATGSRSMRVRTLSDGGPSDFVTCTATPLWDNTPPALPVNRSLKPESSYGRMVYRFTTSASDNSRYDVRYWDGTSWVYPAALQNVSTGNSQSKAHVVTTVPNGGPGVTIQAQVRVRDVYGNESAWSSSSSYNVVASPIFVNSTATGHWRGGVFGANNGNPEQPYAGYYSNPSYDYVGLIVYGNALAGVAAGKTVTEYAIELWREGGGNNVQDAIYVGTTTRTSIPAPLTAGSLVSDNVSNRGTLAYGEGKWMVLTAAQGNAFQSGARHGITIDPPSGKPYLLMTKKSAVSSQGRIRVTHLG